MHSNVEFDSFPLTNHAQRRMQQRRIPSQVLDMVLQHQNRNAQAIAEQCAKLYDEFVGFVENMEDAGKRIEQAQKAYQDAHGKLASGRGCLISQVEKVRALGVKSSKTLPAPLMHGLELAAEEGTEARIG
ncbi:DNA recombination protein RmuC [Viridibacterium curvum]|uniref:Uncharacterized protein n=1 Tax=Viridibacterium curvum TaxID=1101404 RepID=A0ABP9R6M1_9RHOO